MLTILVCGGRTFGVPLCATLEERVRVERDRALLVRTLDELHAATPIRRLVHGDAPGADTLAGQWAAARGVDWRAYPADWDLHGRKAGPIRNAEMLAREMIDLVVAFAGGKDTADMVKKAKQAGKPVIEVG